MSTPPSSQKPLSSKQQEKLNDLTNQSWNLELVISGAALFAVLQLPDVLTQLFDYIHYNLIGQSEGMSRMFPVLVYSTMKVSCYVLFVAFLTNFIMRAFWVGLVGLLAVYPEGIRYDRIPFLSRANQQRMEEEMGSLDAYILSLDKRCNIIFATAFLFVLFLIFVASGYLVVLLLNTVLPPLIPAPYWQAIKVFLGVLLGLYLLLTLFLSFPKWKENPKVQVLQRILTFQNNWLLLGLSRPIGFITNTFYSHVPVGKLTRYVVLMNLLFFVLLLVQMTVDISRINGGKTITFAPRQLYSDKVDSTYVEQAAYDDHRTEDQWIPAASIQSDVITEPFIRLFIAYPKALDTRLAVIAPEPEWPEGIDRKEKNRRYADWSLRRVQHTVRLRLNDSLYQQPDLLFTRRGPHQQAGWQTILIPDNLKKGKNHLRITLRVNAAGKEETLATIPFWYVPGGG